MKEYIETETETEENLHKLHDLVEEGVLTKEQAEHIADGEELTQDDVREIFDKIDEMEELKDVDKYLPAKLRITKDDYYRAMTDDIFRVQTLIKLDTALTII
jgi:polyhydroxyalkanoate synthesis regulator phasin